MGKFFNEGSPIAGFEDYLQYKNKTFKTTKDPKEYESIKTYNYLEFNYYRLKKIAKLLHKKLYNLGTSEFLTEIQEHYQRETREKRLIISEVFSDLDHPFQKRQEEIYLHFFTRK